MGKMVRCILDSYRVCVNRKIKNNNRIVTMKRTVFISILLFVLSLSVQGQTKLSPAQQKHVIELIDKSVKSVSSIQCDFSQTKTMKMLKKTMTSNGVMYFKRDNKLRWQYTSPYDYVFIINGNQVSLKSQNSSQKIDTNKNKVFNQIAKVILNSITGRGLNNGTDFSCVMYKNGATYSAKLYPKKKELKQVYTVIELFFNSKFMVTNVRMEEKTGDVTNIKLSNVKTNTSINEKYFSIN